MSDVPTLARLLGRVDVTADLGAGRWRWTLQRVSAAGYEVRPEFTVRVLREAPERVRLVHDDTDGSGAPATSTTGEVALDAEEGGTRVSFTLQLSLELDVPRLLAPVIRQVLRTNLEQVADHFLTELDRDARGARPND